MYRVVVVDDEQMIRNGVSNMINSEIDDFTCVEVFRDGLEVIEYLQDNDVDVVVSDIKMIHVSGVELAKYIYENKSHIKVVLLSGYSDFEFAKAAVRYKVTDYILKPTDFDELKSVFDGIRKEFADDNAMQERRKFNDRVQKLYACIRDNDEDGGKAVIDELFREIPRNVGEYMRDLYDMLYERLKNHSKITLKPIDTSVLTKENGREQTLEASKLLFEEIFSIFNGENDEYAADVKKYIDNHFCEDISLQSVADAVALSPVYLSRFFKKNMGENFSDYILRLRMEKASEMLAEGKKAADVSDACGFSNPGYFARVFKNYYDCTPKEYVRLNNKMTSN